MHQRIPIRWRLLQPMWGWTAQIVSMLQYQAHKRKKASLNAFAEFSVTEQRQRSHRTASSLPILYFMQSGGSLYLVRWPQLQLYQCIQGVAIPTIQPKLSTHEKKKYASVAIVTIQPYITYDKSNTEIHKCHLYKVSSKNKTHMGRAIGHEKFDWSIKPRRHASMTWWCQTQHASLCSYNTRVTFLTHVPYVPKS